MRVAAIFMLGLAGCPAIFATDHVPRVRPGAFVEIDVTMVPANSGFDTPYLCFEVPETWTVTGVTYEGTTDAQTVVINGAAVADIDATTIMEDNYPQAGFTWSCFAGLDAYYDYTDSGVATAAVQTDQTVGTFPIRVANGSNGGGIPFMSPLGRRISLGELNDPRDDWISAETDLQFSTFLGIAHGAARYVAAAPDGFLVHSMDGDTWTSSVALPYGIRRLRHAGGMFVAVGDNLAVSTSTDGVHWSVGPPTQTGAPPPGLTDVTFGNGLWVASRTDGRIYHSTDTLTWTSTDTPASFNAQLNGIAYGGGRFVTVGGGVILHSTNGTSWTVAIGDEINFVAVAYGNGMFVAGGDGDDAWYSSDGINWSAAPLADAEAIIDITFGNGRFAALNVLTSQVYTSTDAINWNTHDLGTHAFPYAIGFGADQFLVGGFQGYIARSPTPRASSDGPFDLGSIALGANATAVWTITGSTGRLALGNAFLANAPGFSILDDACTGETLAPGGTCAISIGFTPAGAGPASATIEIPTNDPDVPLLSTTISAIAVGPAPNIAVDPTSHDFGTVAVGASSTPRLLIITNSGDVALSVSSVQTAAPFSITNDGCAAQDLAPGANCTFAALFMPTAAGAASGQIQIASNDPDQPTLAVALSGTGGGAPTPDIAVTDSLAPIDDLRVPFTELVPGTTARATITVGNAGNAPLALGGISDPASPFSLDADECSDQSLDPSETCTFDIVFAPADDGTFSGSITISSNDPDAAPVLMLTGSADAKATCTSSPPTAPVLVKPENNAKDVATPTTFGWDEATDPDGNPITYQLFVCETSDFTGCEPTSVAMLLHLGAPRWMLGASLFLNLTACPDQAEKEEELDLKKGTTYFWKVAAVDNTGCRTDSEVRTFTTAE